MSTADEQVPPSNLILSTPEPGLRQGLKTRHIRMIAIGGAIGTGLFLGSGGAIAKTGPALVVTYAVTGLFIYIVMRALGEMLLVYPVNGSFAEYAREFLGPAYGFITGWGYWITWTVIGMAELTAAGIYVQYWFPSVPQWLTALVMLILLVLLNLLAVGAFGEAEFWFASIKIAAILALVIGGIAAMAFGFAPHNSSPSNLWQHGGFAPHGWLAVLLAFQIAVFSYQGVELVGMAAAETQDRERVLPQAINSIPWRIGLFYVGALAVLMCLFPWTGFTKDHSPFVQGFTSMGLPAAGGVMNFVVLTSCLSACSSGIFSNGRLMHRLATDGIAPRSLGRLNKNGVPARGIITSGAFMVIAVVLNYLAPANAFSYIAAVATLGAIWSWGVILACHMAYRRRVARGEALESSFRLPAPTLLCGLGLAFLAGVTILLGFDADNRIALYALPIWAVLLIGGYWFYGRRAMTESIQH